MNNFLRVLVYVRPFKGYALLHILFNLLAILFSLVSLTMVVPFLSLLFDKQELVTTAPVFSWSASWAIGYFNYYLSQIITLNGKEAALFFVCLTVVFIFFLKNVFLYGAKYFMAPIRNGVVRDIRKDIFFKMNSLPLAYFSETRKGDILARITSDVQEIEWSIMSVLGSLIREPATIIAYLAAMLFISPQLTLFVFLVLPLTGIVIGKVGKSLKRKSKKAQERLGVLLSIVEETLAGLRIVKGFNAEGAQAAKFETENQGHFTTMNAMLHRRELSSPLTEFLSIGIVALVLYVGGRMVLTGESALEAETFIGFMVIFSQIIRPAKAFSTAYYHIQKGMASVERVQQIMDAPVTIADQANAVPIVHFKKNILFKKVHFAYVEKPVLSDINFSLAKGKVLALVGASGAGKSTIADLIPRFYDVTDGEILVDGRNIKQLKIKDLRNLIGIVSQEPILFNDTVFNNIAFGKKGEVSEAAVIEAAKIANAHDFIQKLEQGYQTSIGDRGNKLSGGERQRLTIARAVLKNPDILILDEATSSLDSHAEKLVQDALAKLMYNRTSIVIAHRLSTIQFADQILVMDKGQIVQRGTHDVLMGETGLYRELVRLQGF